MADDLLGLFFDPANPDNSIETAWLVCQRCLHGRAAWHLRCYAHQWHPKPNAKPDDEKLARELMQRIENYWPVELRPYLQDGVATQGKKRAPTLRHLGHSKRREVEKQLIRLNNLLAEEISDDDAIECRFNHINPPGFECLRNAWDSC